MPAILDLRTQIGDRINRLKGLIEFIAINGLLGKVSPVSPLVFVPWALESTLTVLLSCTKALAINSSEDLVGHGEASSLC